MTSKELIKQTLENWRFPIIEEGENTIVIRYQMNYVHITSLTDENKSVAVLLSGIFSAENEREERLGMKACNELNFKMLQVKFYLDNDNDLIISSEFFYCNDEDMECLLNIALNAVVSGKKRFVSQYNETEDEDRLMQELNEQD